MSSSGSAHHTSSTGASHSVRGRNDIAWAHVVDNLDEIGRRILTCLYCGKTIRGGGIHRMKLHLAGIKGEVGMCTKVPYDVRFQMQEAMKEIGEKNKEKAEFRKQRNPYGATVHEFEGDMVGEACEEVPPSERIVNESGSGYKQQYTSTKRNRSVGITGYFAPRTTAGAQPSIRSAFAGKEAKWRADMAFARFFYDSCIPMNVVNSIYLQPLVDAIAAIGPGYKHPTYDSLRVNLLRDAKKEVQLLVDGYRKTWEEVGCTLMADGWTDTSHRSLINFLVYCPKGVCFIKSVDASDVVKDAFTLFKLFEEMVLWVGPNNIVHIVTDNGANYKAAGKMLSEKYNSIAWSPCAAHCINLILRDIAEMNHIVDLAKRASEVTKFVYNHIILLAWLRKREGWREIVRPGATRFATTFIALKSLHEHQHDLQAMVTDRFFIDSRYARSHKGKEVIPIILDNGFWDGMAMVSQIVAPLMRLLRIVDSDDRPSIGYVYDGMYRARLGIKKLFKYKKTLYKPYTKIIKERWDRLLRHDIHAAAYFLNPAFQYDQTSFCRKPEVMNGLLNVIEKKSYLFNVSKSKLVDDSRKFRDRLESFSRQLALETSKTTQPDEWWRTYGYSIPTFQKFAIQILSQTSTSSGCERNWSVFERIHSKKRNRLEHQRLNDLVFVHYNLRLKNRMFYKKMNADPIDYESIDKTYFWIVDDEEENGELNCEELEQTLYGEGAIPVGVGDYDSILYDTSQGGDDDGDDIDVSVEQD